MLLKHPLNRKRKRLRPSSVSHKIVIPKPSEFRSQLFLSFSLEFLNPIYSNEAMCTRVSYKNPFTPPLNELVQKHPDVCEDKATDVEAEELGGVTGTEL
jgi:hypothetical protein